MDEPVRRLPIFFGAQAECRVCGKVVRDALTLDQYDRCCSARCYHAQGLPIVGRRGA